MTDGPDNIVLEQLRAIRAAIADLAGKVDRLDQRMVGLDEWMSAIEIREGHSFAVLGQINQRLLGLEQGQRQVEARLEEQGRATAERLAAIERRLPNGRDAT